MSSLILCFVSFIFASFGAYCPAKRVDYCEQPVPGVVPCNTRYQFTWNSTTGQIINQPVVCESFAGGCRKAAPVVSCIPPCSDGKSGGPGGKVCNDFTNQANCRNYYANNGGDKWCWWGPQSSGGNFCYEGITCHN